MKKAAHRQTDREGNQSDGIAMQLTKERG